MDLFTNVIGFDGALTARTDGLTAQLAKIKQDRLDLDERVTTLRERLIRQFTAADSTVSKAEHYNGLYFCATFRVGTKCFR